MYVSKDALNHFLVNSSPKKKQSQKSYKRSIFLILHFGWQANGGGL